MVSEDRSVLSMVIVYGSRVAPLRLRAVFAEAALVRLPREDVRHEVPVLEHAQDVLASLLNTLAHYLTALNVAL